MVHGQLCNMCSFFFGKDLQYVFLCSYSFEFLFSSPLPLINLKFMKQSPLYRRLWGPVRHLESLHPHANPRGDYAGYNLHLISLHGCIFCFYGFLLFFHEDSLGTCSISSIEPRICSGIEFDNVNSALQV